ncbi:putative glycoside hydrolase [Candidatus Parcubacteria bacterium]|nr:putative glycoside hydrolase [Candidatus Parcubacteria bacterium]
MKKPRSSKKTFSWAASAVLFGCLIIFVLPLVLKKSYESSAETLIASPVATTSAATFVVTHVPTPEPTKAIYMTACVAATPSWRESLKKFVEETELNSIVIDVKDYSGSISFEPGANCYVRDLKEYIGELHKSGIYAIGRVTVFQDPSYAKLHPDLAVQSKSGGVWHDHKGLAFIDVGARPYWDYIVELAKRSYGLGFDEINFDYVRYPSDGNMKDASYTWTVASSTKSEMLESFFSYLHDHLLGSGMKTSADLFGLSTLVNDDMGIGQVLEKALPYFDYIDPMVYPSHFASGADGYASPAEHPYEIIQYSMASGVRKEQALNAIMGIASSTPSKLRPWIQDFKLLGVAYGVPEVQAQMRATYDVGLTSWLSWDASNKYTQKAYLPN